LRLSIYGRVKGKNAYLGSYKELTREEALVKARKTKAEALSIQVREGLRR
jgi:hypothetical protein